MIKRRRDESTCSLRSLKTRVTKAAKIQKKLARPTKPMVAAICMTMLCAFSGVPFHSRIQYRAKRYWGKAIWKVSRPLPNQKWSRSICRAERQM